MKVETKTILRMDSGVGDPILGGSVDFVVVAVVEGCIGGGFMDTGLTLMITFRFGDCDLSSVVWISFGHSTLYGREKRQR